MRLGALRILAVRLAVVRLLIAALIFPVVLAAVPKPALTAEQALQVALDASICKQTGQDRNKVPGEDHSQNCILCPVACSMAHVAMVTAPPASCVEAASGILKGHFAVAPSEARIRNWYSSSSPRGPPIG
ncbi:MAG: hypothetical protein U1E46_00430 [Hyphomicrobiales bacterium]